MDNAADKPAQSASRGKKRVERETPHSDHNRELAKQARAEKTRNPVTDSFYELVRGEKLVLCKRKASGSVFRVLIGSTKDKETGDQIKLQIQKLEKEGRLRNRV